MIGITFCWSTPVTSKLEGLIDNPLGFSISVSQSSWLSSLTSLGAVVGPFSGGYFSDSIGRKWSLIGTAILAIASFAILAFATNLYLFYLAKFIGGICLGTFLTVIPMYIGEIAEIHNRGILGGFCSVFIVLGNMFCFTIGPYVSIQVFSLMCMIFPTLFVILCVMFVPESPCYLIMKGQHEEARKSLEKLRQSDNIEDEIMELTATVKESLANRGGIIDVIKTDYLCRGLIITTGIVIIQQFSAISPILLYMHEIFENAGSSLSKEYATIIVGVVQIVATLISSFVIDRLGRRPLMFISIVPLCISLLTLSLYFYLKSLMDVSHISWLPVTALLVYVIFFNMGMGPLAIVVLSEIFPPHVKSSATSFTIATCFFVSFGVSKVFPLLGALFGQWFPFLICGVATTVGIIFMWFRLPETKGKHLSEILESLK